MKRIAKSSYEKPRTGRPPSKPPANAAELIFEAASKGANQKSIHFALRCSAEVFRRWVEEQPELQEALDRGREEERRTLHNVLYRLATEGSGKESMVAAMFLLKSRHAGYIEGSPSEQQGNRVSINFQLPGAQPLDKFMVIDNAADPGAERVSAKPLSLTRAG